MNKTRPGITTNRLLSVFLAVTLFFCFSYLSQADITIIGEWSGIDSDGEKATFVFGEDNSAEIHFEGLPPLSTQNLTNGSVQWSRNAAKHPMAIDVIIMIDSEERNRIPMIAQFVDSHTLKIQISRDMKTRPKGFDITDAVFQIVTTKQ